MGDPEAGAFSVKVKAEAEADEDDCLDSEDPYSSFANESGIPNEDMKVARRVRRLPPRRRQKKGHESIKSRPIEIPATCSACLKTFASHIKLKSHIKIVHDDDPVDCEGCGKTFKNRELKRCHYNRVHVRGSEPRPKKPAVTSTCPTCFKTFGSKSHLQSHINIVHDNVSADCEVCGKTFKNKELKRHHYRFAHVRSNPLGTGPVFRATTSLGTANHRQGLSERRIENLNCIPWERLRVPVTSRQEYIICGYCDKSFSDQDTFLQHSKLNHRIQENVWKCAIALCNKLFRTERHLNKHKRKMHDHPDETFSSFPQQLKNKSLNLWCKNSPEPDHIEVCPSEANFEHFADDWLESNTVDSSPPSLSGSAPDILKREVYPVLPEPAAAVEKQPLPELSLEQLENMKQCPKLKMNFKVKVKKLKPAPQIGYVFCHICCENFIRTTTLKQHMYFVHGIDYVPKKKTPRIAKILSEMRGESRLCTRNRKPSENVPEQDEAENDEDGSTGNKPPACPICNMELDTQANLRQHMITSHKDKQQECKLCGKIVANRNGLSRHMRCVHDSNLNNPLNCHACPKVFRNIFRLKCHITKVHEADPDTYKCRKCGKGYKTFAGLRQHVKVAHEHKEYMCDKCSRVFTQKPALRRHLVFVHKQIDNPTGHAARLYIKLQKNDHQSTLYQCEVCGKELKNKDTLNEHMNQKHLKSTNYRCLFCSKRLPTSRLKRLHEFQYHGSPSGFGCKVCDQFCDTAHVLEKHVANEHSQATLQELYYEPAKSINPPAQKVYTNYHLNNEPQGSLSFSAEQLKARQLRVNYHKPRPCAFCGAMCASRRHEVKHVLDYHPDYAEFRCADCRVGFTSLRLLNLHKLDIHKINRSRTRKVDVEKVNIPIFNCGVCSKPFVSAEGRDKHQQSAHPG